MTVTTVALRFVPYDQWLVTHLDDAAKVRQAKHWFLSKCNLAHPPPHPRRPVSPITFAPSVHARASVDSVDDGYNEDDEHSDHDPPPARHAPPSPSAQPGSSPLVEQYTLVSFSTGAILEDEFTLAWYNLRPYELLEMHPAGTIAPLQRDVLAEYVQPYFQAKVRVLRAVWNYRSGRFEVPGIDAHRDVKFAPKPAATPEKRRKAKVDWKARWVVISQGVLSLCKGHASSPPLQQFPLTSIGALHGADALERVFSVVAEPRVVCIKFRRRPVSLASVAPPPSLPASPISEHTRTPDPQTADQEDRPSGDYAHDPNDDDGEVDWIVLDMLDDHAFSSILRILHRQARCPISSSFIPTSNVITVSHPYTPSPTATSFTSYDAIPYPEWRTITVENARKAGMGDVGKPMAWVIWTDKGLGDSLMSNIRCHRQAFSREMQYKTKIAPWNVYASSDDESDGESESEMEWEGWMRDLDRQNQVKKARSKQASLTSSPFPSPPPSEGSTSGSPRVRSPSLSYAQYPNIGNVIKSTTVSTVSVGAAPYPRRRSSTLTAEVTPNNKGKDNEPFPSAAARTSARTASTSACLPSSPRTIIRHFHSSSNLRLSSSYGSDAAESPGKPATSSPARRQRTFMRGVSLRAGKLVRGLESAIDFVDEKTA